MAFRVAQDIVTEFHRRHSTSHRMWEYQAATLRYAAEVLFRQAFADTAGSFGIVGGRHYAPR